MKFAFGIAALAMLATGSAGASTMTTLDLNDFFFFAGDPVVVAVDGSSAMIGESALASPIVLSNDPGQGDANIIVAAANRVLSFDYAFSEGAGNDDEFFGFLLDGNTGTSLGSMFEFATANSASGTVSFELGSLVGTTLGLQFQLGSLFGDAGQLDSTLTISNLALTDNIAPIPLPASLPLLAFGAAGLGLAARRRRAHLPKA